MIPFVRSPYNYDADAVSAETGVCCEEPTLAQQQFKDNADINVIMERFGHGVPLPENFRAPMYGDFVGINDFHAAMNAVAAAGEAFDSLPAELRARFDNDPAKLIDFVSSDVNKAEAVKLGLVPPPPAEPVVGVSGALAPDAKPAAPVVPPVA